PPAAVRFTPLWKTSRGGGWGRSRGATGGEPWPPLASAASRRVGPCTRSAVQRSCTGGPGAASASVTLGLGVPGNLLWRISGVSWQADSERSGPTPASAVPIITEYRQPGHPKRNREGDSPSPSSARFRATAFPRSAPSRPSRRGGSRLLALRIAARRAVRAAVLMHELRAAVGADADELQPRRMVTVAGGFAVRRARGNHRHRHRLRLAELQALLPGGAHRLRQHIRARELLVRPEILPVQGAAQCQGHGLRDRGHPDHRPAAGAVKCHFFALHPPQLFDDLAGIDPPAQRERGQPADPLGLDIERVHEYLAHTPLVLVDHYVNPAAGRFHTLGAAHGDLGAGARGGHPPLLHNRRRRRGLCGGLLFGDQDTLATGLPVYRDPLGTELPRQQVHALNLLWRRVAREVHGAADGVVNVLLDRRLHLHPHLRLDLVGGDEERRQVVLPLDLKPGHVLPHQRMVDLEGLLRQRLGTPDVGAIEDG